MNEYKVIGKVFGRPFERSFKINNNESEDEYIERLEWLFSEGNYQCDCNKGGFVGIEDQPCGDLEEYSELKLYKDGVEIFDFVKYWEAYA